MSQSSRHLFGIPDSVHYLNCAYMSPFLKRQEEVGVEVMGQMLKPYTIKAPDFFEPVDEVRRLIAQLVGIPNSEDIAIVPSVSYGVSTITQSIDLVPGDRIILTGEQFPSNVYPWLSAANRTGAEVVFVDRPQDGSLTWSEKILDAIDERTAVVAMGHVHWTDGHIFDLKSISDATKKNAGLLIIDGTQSIGALPFSFADIQPDALICAAYKWLLGPYSVGFAYFGDNLKGLSPIEYSWMTRKDSENFKELVNYQPEYLPGAGKFAMGENANFIAMPIWKAGLQQLIEWTPEFIQETLTERVNQWSSRWLEIGLKPDNRCGRHMFGIPLPTGIDTQKLLGLFEQEQVYVSLRGNSIRIAPHHHCDEHDFEALTKCFARLLEKT